MPSSCGSLHGVIGLFNYRRPTGRLFIKETFMTTRSRPISYRLRQSRNNKTKQVEKAQEWADEWYRDTIVLLKTINDTASEDWDAFDNALAQLRQNAHRKHDALQNVFKILATPVDKE